ncbi:transcriptional regulator PchE, partial [Escherichia coli O111:H11 str. CVM9455]
GEVMQLVETDKERHHITMRRLECCRKAQRPPEPPDNYGDLKKAVDRTYAEMGIWMVLVMKYGEITRTANHTAGEIRLFLHQLKRYGALPGFRHGLA